MHTQGDYDITNPESIEAYAKRLIGQSLRDVLPSDARTTYQSGRGKGNLGDLVEQEYFGIHPGNISAPDFIEAGVELKTTPLKRVGKSFRAKERLVLQMIKYNDVHKEDWEHSTFLAKNGLLLLMFYLWESGVAPIDYVFKIARLWSFPEADLEIIRDDWETIVGKIRDGRAHELSERDTRYLAACTKAATGAVLRSQPFCSQDAQPRAFSLKPSYMNFVIDESIGAQSAVTAEELKTGKTLEQLIHERFMPYVGMTADQIAREVGVTADRAAKNYYSVLTNRMLRPILGIASDREVAEFEKAGITMRTMRLKPTGTPKEAVSFKAFDYIDLVNQEWLTSDLRNELMRRFFFIVYDLDKNDVPTLARTQFWSMPQEDVDGPGRECFERTVALIREDKAEHLPRSTENRVCHVRPHGRDASDKVLTPTGRWVTRKSFWLNQRYLAGQLAGGEDS